MKKYLDLHNDSSVIAYEIGDNYIDVMFKNHRIYRYSYSSAGIYKVEKMKNLALQGYGLGSYILLNAKFDYE